MSNIGKQPIILPDGVEINISNDIVTIKGKKGELSLEYDKLIKIEKIESAVEVSRKDDSRKERSLHGLYRALINNMVVGVTDGFSKELNLVGVGFTADASKGDFLILNIGFSHAIYFENSGPGSALLRSIKLLSKSWLDLFKFWINFVSNIIL